MLSDRVIKWGRVMKRHEHQHEGHCGLFLFELPLFLCGWMLAWIEITPPLSGYQHDFTPGEEKATHLAFHRRGNCFGRWCHLRDVRVIFTHFFFFMQETDRRPLTWRLPHYWGTVKLRAACCSITVCRAEASSNMRIIHLASLCVKIPTCPGFSRL